MPTSTGHLARLHAVSTLIDLALEEDLGRGDVTTEAVLDDPSASSLAVVVAREPLVLFGLEIAMAVFERVDPWLDLRPVARDGQAVAAGATVLELEGAAASILRGERTALNFLQHLSGIASLTRQFVDAVAGTGARVVDTRKTTPGFRLLEKAAVRAGGAGNHRADLGSGILIKDNHVVACGSVARAVARARSSAPHPLRVEVEVGDLAQLEEALDAGAEIVLLDNMGVDEVAEAARRAHARQVLVEVSGGIRLETAAAYARAGADILSAGALTHSAPAADLALDFCEG